MRIVIEQQESHQQASRESLTRRNFLPLRLFNRDADAEARFDAAETGIPNKCVWKCAAMCCHEAPNEERTRGNALADE